MNFQASKTEESGNSERNMETFRKLWKAATDKTLLNWMEPLFQHSQQEDEELHIGKQWGEPQ